MSGRAALYPAIGSDGKAWSCVRTGLDWYREKVFHPEGGQEPEQVPQRSGDCQSSSLVWTTLSGTWEMFLMLDADLGARWSLWFPSHRGHSVTLLRCEQLRDPLTPSSHRWTSFTCSLSQFDPPLGCTHQSRPGTECLLSQNLLKPNPTPGAIRVSLERCCALGNTCKAVSAHWGTTALPSSVPCVSAKAAQPCSGGRFIDI